MAERDYNCKCAKCLRETKEHLNKLTNDKLTNDNISSSSRGEIKQKLDDLLKSITELSELL